MIISFEIKELRKVCENEEIAIKQFGMQISMKLQDRLADLIAAISVNDLLVGNPGVKEKHPLLAYKVDLCDGFELIFISNHVKSPVSEQGKLDWNKVNRIKILEIQSN